MKHLTEKHLRKLVSIIGVPFETIVKLDAMNLLDASGVLSLVIKYDWKKMVAKNPRFTNDQLMRIMVNEYNVSQGFIASAVKAKRNSVHFCRECGEEIGPDEYRRNSGYCSHCYVNAVRI